MIKYQIQVSEGPRGPWFALNLRDRGEWKLGEEGGFSTLDTNQVNQIVPLIREQGDAFPRTLWYRSREVDSNGITGDWSLPKQITSDPITTDQLAQGSITSTKLNPTIFGDLASENLMAYWSMDDSVSGQSPSSLGEIIDLSEHTKNYPLRIIGPVFSRDGVAGKSLFFSDNDGYAESVILGEGQNSFTDMSIVGFAKFVNEREDLIFTYTKEDFTLSMKIDNINNTGEVEIIRGDTTYDIVVPINPVVLNWHQWGFTFSDSTYKFYFDGVAVGSGLFGPTIPQGGRIKFGDGFIGCIDEVRIYDRELTPAEIQFLKLTPGAGTSNVLNINSIVANSITAGKLSAEVLNALIAYLDDRLAIGNFFGARGYIAGNYPNPVLNELRTYLDTGELKFERYQTGSVSVDPNTGDTTIIEAGWVEQGRMHQDQNGCYIKLSNNVGDVTEIEPNGIVLRRGERNVRFYMDNFGRLNLDFDNKEFQPRAYIRVNNRGL